MRVCFRYGCSFFRLEALTNVLPIGKEQGSKTTLPAMLKKCSDELSAEFSMLSKSEKMRFLPIVSKPRRRRVLQNVYQMLLLVR
jgi:hypothetical protein